MRTQSDLDILITALDVLALALATHDHQWTEEESTLLSAAIAICDDPDDTWIERPRIKEHTVH